LRYLPVLLCLCALAQTETPDDQLLGAARKGDLPAVKSLLDKGANLETKSRYGQTPLFFAARNGHEEVVQLLLQKGANPNVSDTFYKMSLLAAAADKGYVGIVRALLAKGAQGASGALQMAAYRGSTDMAAMLLESQKFSAVDLSAALQSAEQAKKPEIVELLRKAGAVPGAKPDYKVSGERLALYAGTYKGEPIGEVTVTLKEGTLFLSLQGKQMELGAYDDATFGFVQSPQQKLRFVVADGKAIEIRIPQRGEDTVLKRVEGK